MAVPGATDQDVEIPTDDMVEFDLGEHDQAEARNAMRRRGRQVGGVSGAVVAGIMVALRDIYEAPPRDSGAVVVDSPSEPHDVERDGIDLAAADLDAPVGVTIAALERRPVVTARRSRRWTAVGRRDRRPSS